MIDDISYPKKYKKYSYKHISKSLTLTDYNASHQIKYFTKFTQMIWNITSVILYAILFTIYIIVTQQFISQFVSSYLHLSKHCTENITHSFQIYFVLLPSTNIKYSTTQYTKTEW